MVVCLCWAVNKHTHKEENQKHKWRVGNNKVLEGEVMSGWNRSGGTVGSSGRVLDSVVGRAIDIDQGRFMKSSFHQFKLFAPRSSLHSANRGLKQGHCTSYFKAGCGVEEAVTFRSLNNTCATSSLCESTLSRQLSRWQELIFSVKSI